MNEELKERAREIQERLRLLICQVTQIENIPTVSLLDDCLEVIDDQQEALEAAEQQVAELQAERLALREENERLGESDMDEMKKRGLCAFTFTRIGDRVFTVDQGFGEVVEFLFANSLLTVKFDSGAYKSFTISGAEVKKMYTPADTQLLFWDEACTTQPMMPLFVYDRDEVLGFQGWIPARVTWRFAGAHTGGISA